MLKRFCSWLLYKRMGWSKDIRVSIPDKCVICVAPHTSNWDFIIGQLYSRADGVRANFLMKREWFKGPLGSFFKSIGGIPVQRDKHISMTDSLADEVHKHSSFRLCITPEGTRSATGEWKKGFYYIAHKAGIPIMLYGIDYEKKLIRCSKAVMPSGEFEKDMNEIKLYYKDFKGKYPENFTIGETE